MSRIFATETKSGKVLQPVGRRKVFYDQTGNTLTVWFGKPQDEYVCEEAADEVILMKDASGPVIGFEKLNFTLAKPEPLRVAFEALTV